MEIITGYFNSSQQAVEAAEYLRQHGFKGEISIIGRHNEEAFVRDTLQDKGAQNIHS